MYTIGQFAQITGLTVKALRHYDETGLLPPARVDEFTGYRSYAPTQVRAAATINLLRAMEVPLPTIREALAAPDRLEELLDSFTAERQARRDREDAITTEARSILRAYDRTSPIIQREVLEQPWVGAAMTVDLTDPQIEEEGTTDAFNAAFDALFAEAWHGGLEPVGYWWLDFAESTSPDAVELRWGIPVAKLPDAPLTTLPEGARYEQGVDPAHTEHVADAGVMGALGGGAPAAGEDSAADAPAASDAPVPPASSTSDSTSEEQEETLVLSTLTDAPHPAVLALLEADTNESRMRQNYRLDGGMVRMEITTWSAP